MRPHVYTLPGDIDVYGKIIDFYFSGIIFKHLLFCLLLRQAFNNHWGADVLFFKVKMSENKSSHKPDCL